MYRLSRGTFGRVIGQALEWWDHHPWKDFSNICVWCLGTSFSGGLGSAELS